MRRLSAVGGSGLESLTRRILKFLITDEVAELYNWKGREKLSFENTHLVGVIRSNEIIKPYKHIASFKLSYFLEAVKIHFPIDEQNDLNVENTIQDWLKFAKTRRTRRSTKRNSATT